ncbi:MAG TPA: hypothetical protein VFK69_05205 [Candidatus Eisenbacteria bacterium]|nr:hypothetical protein [Candidatus Eisenbacteria bacterium]
MKSALPSMALVVLFMGSIAPCAGGAVVLDQSYTGPDVSSFGGGITYLGSDYRQVQTFVVGVSGVFHHADALVYAYGPPPSNLVSARLLAITAWVPNGTVLATTSTVSILPDGWTSFDFSASGVTVAPGQVLGLEPIAGASGPEWSGSSYNPYAPGEVVSHLQGGHGWIIGSQFDAAFRTYVDATPTAAATSTWGRVKALYRASAN